MIRKALLAFWLAATIHLTSALAATKELVLIKTTRLIDMRTGTLLSDQAILIEGEKIVEIGPSFRLSHPASGKLKVVDLSGLTVLPGLIDCHAHVLGNLKDLSASAPLRMSSPQATLWGVHNLQTWLNHGFTTLRDAGESDLAYGQLALRDSIRMGLIQGPRMVSAGNFISVTGGHGDADVLAPDQALARRPNLTDSVDDVSAAVRHEIKYGADWIKLVATGGISDPMSDFNVQELSEQQMRTAVEVAHRAHKPVMAHAEGADGIKAAVRAGVDSIEHGTMLDDAGAALMLIPCAAVHTAFMRFPIDLVFIDGDGRTVRTASRVPPWRIALAFRARAVIELPAGRLDACEIKRILHTDGLSLRLVKALCEDSRRGGERSHSAFSHRPLQGGGYGSGPVAR